MYYIAFQCKKKEEEQTKTNQNKTIRWADWRISYKIDSFFKEKFNDSKEDCSRLKDMTANLMILDGVLDPCL